MTSGAELVYDILNQEYVDGSVWDAYGEKPDIKIDQLDNLFYMKPGKGIKLANQEGEDFQNYTGTVDYTDHIVVATIAETTSDLREAILAGVKELLKNQPILMERFNYEEIYPKVFRKIYTLKISEV